MERRYLTPSPVELRADGDKPVIEGYAATFYSSEDSGTEYQLGPGLRERVMPTAFDQALKDPGAVCGLFNHDPNHLLGRCSAGTMRLATDAKGLRYRITPPDTQTGRDVVAMIKRGDLTSSSFSFRAIKQRFVPGIKSTSGIMPGMGRPMFDGGPRGGMDIECNPDEDECDIRELHEVELNDCGPVSMPAYSATTVGLRADLAPEVRSAWQEWRAGTKVQSVLVPRDRFSRTEAEQWAKDHDFKAEVDESDQYYRFRQFDPGQCSALRTITLSEKEGIKAVVCIPKEAKSLWLPSRALLRRRLRLAEVE